MSPPAGEIFDVEGGGPRASGDEPIEKHKAGKDYSWSPRERG